MKFFILFIFTIQTCFAQNQSISATSVVNPDLEAIKLVYQAANSFTDLESMINFIGVAINKVDQLSALKAKIGLGSLKMKLSNVKLENNILNYENEKINVKNGKVYFNQLIISFNPKLTLAENYDKILSSLKKYKDQKKSVLFRQLIPSAYAIDKPVAYGLVAIAVYVIVSAAIALYLAAYGVPTLAAGLIGGLLTFSTGSALLMASKAHGSTFLQNYKEVCQPRGPNSYTNSYIDKDGVTNETNLMLKDGLLVMTLKSNNKHKNTLILEPKSNRVVKEYDENKNLISPEKTTKMTEQESEGLYSIYKICADPELRKEFKAKINEYSKLQYPIQPEHPGNSADNPTPSVH